MNKATPIPDTVQRRANGSIEIASCAKCGGKITRALGLRGTLPWWHAETARVYCAERKA
jgi:hypothetical protein